MEYTQWGRVLSLTDEASSVLILVVMEYTQWEVSKVQQKRTLCNVLILVVMEYTQWE